MPKKKKKSTVAFKRGGKIRDGVTKGRERKGKGFLMKRVTEKRKPRESPEGKRGRLHKAMGEKKKKHSKTVATAPMLRDTAFWV